MIKYTLALFLVWAGPLFAVPVQVTSGEHDGFTRIVLNFGAQVNWEFGRALDGYRFRSIGTVAEYDLKPIFDRIGKTRLAAISANSKTSELDIGFACGCHAIPFEFRPGIIVIDLRDGPAPNGSSFENPLSVANQADVSKQTAGQQSEENTLLLDVQPSYDWVDRFMVKGTIAPPSVASQASPLPTSNPNLQPLRDQLLRQLSRGASEGVIDLAVQKAKGTLPPKVALDDARVALGELGGVATKTVRAPETPLGSDGAKCVENSALNVLEWAEKADTSTLLSQDMVTLVGEFDMPFAEAVTRAAKVRIYLGFGAEVRLVLEAFPLGSKPETMLKSLSYIVDGEADPTQFFAGQGRCTTSAALWAALSDKGISQKNDLDTKAVILGFSGLPDHLRRVIGPQLIDRLLNLGDDVSATTIRNIVFRSGVAASSEVSLAEAKIDLAKGHPAAAEGHLDNTQNGATLTAAEALVTRVKARIAQGLPVDKTTVTGLAALQSEMVNTPLAAEIAAAIIHAQAASGDFAAAFAALPDHPKEAAVVWRALSELGDDAALLTFSLPPPNGLVAGLTDKSINTISVRLLGLGLPDAALEWAQKGAVKEGTLLAEIHLARRDGRAALTALDGQSAPAAMKIRAQAFSLLGNHSDAAKDFELLSDEAQSIELARAKDWESLAKIPDTPWMALTRDLTRPAGKTKEDVDTFGPLSRGLALADKSAATRADIENLLMAIDPNLQSSVQK